MLISAFFLAVTRIHVRWTNRRYEYSRWMISSALLLMAAHFFLQMHYGFRATSTYLGAVINIMVYQPCFTLFAMAIYNVEATHMNFGWDGGGDAYFSLTNLSLQETGDEFGNKPLAFNRAITAILAHPNNGKYPAIDPGLLENMPQLMFNEGGTFTMKDAADKAFDAHKEQTIEMTSFVNKGKAFKGDVGVAIYDAEGNFKSVAYSDDHATGGFTQRIFGDYGGSMGTDNLMVHTLYTKVSFDGLPNGYYRLVPVCAAMGEDGTWGDFLRMKKAPTIEVELTDGKGRISETCSTENVVFQLMNQPRLSASAEQGESIYAYFNLKNLNGVPRDCYLRVQLLDEAKQVVLNTRVDQLTEIEGFTEMEIPVKLSIPTDLAPARYEVKLEATRDQEETDSYPINNIHEKEKRRIICVKYFDTYI
jgi:hypothetical protein